MADGNAKIVIGIDNSEHSERAFECKYTLAKFFFEDIIKIL